MNIALKKNKIRHIRNNHKQIYYFKNVKKYYLSQFFFYFKSTASVDGASAKCPLHLFKQTDFLT